MFAFIRLILFFALSYFSIAYLTKMVIGPNGFWGDWVSYSPVLFIFIYSVIIAHLTITAMSLSFHRYHTHKGVVLNELVDFSMQVWLWIVTTLSKLDWVAVHVYHHAHSDDPKDPHSPVQKGIWHALFFGVFDYTQAKSWPEITRIRRALPANKWERFIFDNPFLGPYLFSALLIFLFGPLWGAVLAVINFLVSPIFAIGGVNALAHWWGYRNHSTKDNSRNLGFLLPLNFIICGELDHNNHHAHQKSCSFRHRWFEFDIGYFYLKLLSYLNLAKIYHAYTPVALKEEFSKKMLQLIEKDHRFKKRCEELSQELNINYQDLKVKMALYSSGKKVKLEKSVRQLIREIRRTINANEKLRLSYS